MTNFFFIIAISGSNVAKNGVKVGEEKAAAAAVAAGSKRKIEEIDQTSSAPAAAAMDVDEAPAEKKVKIQSA